MRRNNNIISNNQPLRGIALTLKTAHNLFMAIKRENKKMGFMRLLYDKFFQKKKKGHEKFQKLLFDPWIETNIDEDKIRNLLKVRVCYVSHINPHSPDLDEFLEEMITTAEQKSAIKRIWFEEAHKFIENNGEVHYD